ncbi:MAG TPA: GNAT family N-acetyltransferase [Thermoanaerobaculia bacterium]|nr:GNAT family N-acetyltransferase [Thermoanaerobaculia bacterium]
MSLEYRPANELDINAMAELRASEWGSVPYWQARIHGYWAGEIDPTQALKPRALFVAMDGDDLAGFIAGHLTRRYRCDGELQWINVAKEQRRKGVASELLLLLAAWFGQHLAKRVCIDVDPDNQAGRSFYLRHGAAPLNRHWLVWPDISCLVPRDLP